MSMRTISTVSSAQLRVEISSYFFAFAQPTTTAPETSCLSPRTTESETVTTATRIYRFALNDLSQGLQPKANSVQRVAGSRSVQRVASHRSVPVDSTSQPASFFVERHFHDRSWNPFPPNLYLQRRSFRCKLGRDVCSPDRNAECRTQRSAP